MTTKQPPAQKHLDISDDELLKRNEKYMKANKSSKNTFDDLDFAYYHGQCDIIDELKLAPNEPAIKSVVVEIKLPEKKQFSESPMMDKYQQMELQGFNKCLAEIKRINGLGD